MFKGRILLVLLLAVLVIVVIILVSRSSPPIPEEKFVQLYIELSLAHEKYKYNPPELDKEKKRILEESKVTMEDVDEFIAAYKKKPEKWVKLWERINQELERLQREGSLTPP